MDSARLSPVDSPLEAKAPQRRRRRLWEVFPRCHCAIVGVCLPATALRRLAKKVLVNPEMVDDYALHLKAVLDCATRNPFSKAIQEELEARHVASIQDFRGLLQPAELEQGWRAALGRGQTAGALWAILTHPACDDVFAKRLDQELHLLQHHAISLMNADSMRFQALIEENAALTTALAKAQQRSERAISDRAAEVDALQAQLMRLRAEGSAKDSEMANLRGERDEARRAVPDATTRRRQEHQIAYYRERHTRLQQEIAMVRSQLAQGRREPPAAAPEHRPVLVPTDKADALAPSFEERHILCVGGREHAVAIYRRLIERAGAHFLHHDGGIEDRLQQLDKDLSAADLVICQTGCISHNAYWRVKDFCKRTGKRCVFVDKPSASSLARGLEDLMVIALATLPDAPQN